MGGTVTNKNKLAFPLSFPSLALLETTQWMKLFFHPLVYPSPIKLMSKNKEKHSEWPRTERYTTGSAILKVECPDSKEHQEMKTRQEEVGYETTWMKEG